MIAMRMRIRRYFRLQCTISLSVCVQRTYRCGKGNLTMSTAFNPPPKPKKALSPWAWTAIGCGGLFTVAILALIVFVTVIAGNVKTEMAKPFDRAAVLSVIGDLPLYPDASINELQSKAARAGLKAMSFAIPAGNSAALALDCNAPTSKVISWYDEELVKQGWKPLGIRENTGRNQQHQYMKNKDMALVQVQDSPKGDSKTIILMRFRDLKK